LRRRYAAKLDFCRFWEGKFKKMPRKLVILGLEAPPSPTSGVAKTVRRTENPGKMGLSGLLKMAEVELKTPHKRA